MRRKPVVFLLICILVTGLVLAAGCSSGKPAPEPEKPKEAEPAKTEAPKEPIRIGVIAPLSGDVATYGTSTKQAIELAAAERNAKGGILGRQIKLYVEDERNIPEEGANAALKLINQDKVVALIGSVASKVSLAVAPIAQQNNIPMITPTSTNVKVTQQGDYIFRACFIDPFQGRVMAQFAVNSLKARTAAVLFDLSNDYTKGLAEAFKENFEKMGGRVLAWETYNVGDQDFRGQLTKIKGTNPEVLFLPDYYSTVGLIAKQARELGIKSAFLGGDGWDSPDLVKIGGDAVEGGYFSNHYSPELKTPEALAFIDAYKAKYGSVPDALAALAYDAALILFDAIEKAGTTDGKAIRDAMASISIKGVSGAISFDENRNPVKSAVVITIENGKQKLVEQVNPQ